MTLQNLSAVRNAARSYCEALEQSAGVSQVDLLQRFHQILGDLTLAEALPETDPPPEPENDSMFTDGDDESAAMRAMMEGQAAMGAYMANYQKAHGLLSGIMTSAPVPGVTPPESGKAATRTAASLMLTEMLSIVYAGLLDLIDQESETPAETHVWYWRSQLTGFWGENQLQPTRRAVQAYLNDFT